MANTEGAYVALFIDWDNLAISTAADHGGALPDLRRILQVAQGYGTVLLARAYAEWGVTSDRLTVFRAGIEPVYAPTFRFEADIPGQPSRGKSLADPILVADCVDALHLHPQITHMVIVSGDKDLIAVVRLAQLRGKKVVVIGPDLVAAVLRDMADEYVSYRSLVAGAGEGARSATVRAEAAELGRRRRRRRGRGGGAGEDAETPEEPTVTEPGAGPEPQTTHAPRGRGGRERRPFADRAGVLRPRAEEPEAAAEPAEPAETPEPPARRERARAERPEPVAAEPPPPAPRAEPAPVVQGDTSELFAAIGQILKERTTSGRPRLRATNLKDYLIARMPGFNERRYGFGQFRELLEAAERAGALAIQEDGPVQWISLPAPGTTPTAATSAPAAPAEQPAAAPAAAPTVEATEAAPTIEPVEAVAVLVELRRRAPVLTQGVVNSALTALARERGAGERAEEEARRILEALVNEGAVRVDREPQEVELNGARHRVRLCHLVDDNALVRQAEEGRQPAEAAAEGSPSARGRRSRRGGRGRGGSATPEEVTTATESGGAAEAPAGESEAAQPEAGGRRRGRGRGQPESNGIPANVLDALVEAVRESIPPDRDTAGAAGVKSRLTRALGEFDEGTFGFSKFKDFLLAAEKSGRIRVESAGAATRVGLA